MPQARAEVNKKGRPRRDAQMNHKTSLELNRQLGVWFSLAKLNWVLNLVIDLLLNVLNFLHWFLWQIIILLNLLFRVVLFLVFPTVLLRFISKRFNRWLVLLIQTFVWRWSLVFSVSVGFVVSFFNGGRL